MSKHEDERNKPETPDLVIHSAGTNDSAVPIKATVGVSGKGIKHAKGIADALTALGLNVDIKELPPVEED